MIILIIQTILFYVSFEFGMKKKNYNNRHILRRRAHSNYTCIR